MIKPVGKHVLVKVESLEDTDPVFKRAKAAGINLPQHKNVELERRAVDRALVVGIGAGAWKDWFDGSPWCKVGDMVIFAKYGGKVVKDGEVEYTLLNDEDILAIVDRS